MGYRQISRRIQEAREEAGLSQTELAARIGRTQAALSNYELGKRRVYLADLERIASALARPLNYFLEDETAGESGAERSEQLSALLGVKDLREILVAASDLPVAERKAVLDYIRWKRDRLREEARDNERLRVE